MRKVKRTGSFYTSATLYKVTVEKMDELTEELGLSRSGIIRLACQWALKQKGFLEHLRNSCGIS